MNLFTDVFSQVPDKRGWDDRENNFAISSKPLKDQKKKDPQPKTSGE